MEKPRTAANGDRNIAALRPRAQGNVKEGVAGVEIRFSAITRLTYAIEILGITECEASTGTGPLAVTPDVRGNRCKIEVINFESSVCIRWKSIE